MPFHSRVLSPSGSRLACIGKNRDITKHFKHSFYCVYELSDGVNHYSGNPSLVIHRTMFCHIAFINGSFNALLLPGKKINTHVLILNDLNTWHAFYAFIFSKQKEDCGNEIPSSTRDIHVTYTWRIAILNTERSYKRQGHAPLKYFVGFLCNGGKPE